MNRWGLMSALALAAALLLAGCGGDYGLSDDDSADEPQITLEQIRAANDPRSLLEKHGAVTVTVQESDQNDAVTYTAKFQYTRGVEDVLAWYHCRYTENSTSGKSELWSEANGTMDAARMESDSTEDLSLSIYLEGKYEQYVLDMIPRCPALEEDVEQTVDSCSEQDGELLLSVTARYLASDGDYYTVHYRVDPATNEVLEASVTDYIKKESGEVSKLHTTLYRWSYDEALSGRAQCDERGSVFDGQQGGRLRSDVLLSRAGLGEGLGRLGERLERQRDPRGAWHAHPLPRQCGSRTLCGQGADQAHRLLRRRRHERRERNGLYRAAGRKPLKEFETRA